MTLESNASGIASWDYAKKAQQYMKLVTVLRSAGTQVDIDLPRIVVIGNQSAGKSSLVEAITGITVPRASGTYTRCPMECRLNYSPEPFKAQVFLRFEKDENGMPLPEAKLEMTQEVKFGHILDDKSGVEDMLERAQHAILNPSLPMKNFSDPSSYDTSATNPNQAHQLQFSSNVVCLDIYCPEVTDLSFIDLPGIISNVSEEENPENIALVRNLTKEYIEGSGLILLTLTMRDDIQNQAAAQLAKEADPQGLRTIGILTKPDILQEREHQSWLDILSGQTHRLRHGYYVIKQPATRELAEKLTHEEICKREQEFFSDNSPWNKVGASVRARMGIPKLTKELSKLLSHAIESTLPKLRADAKASHSKCLKELQELPPAPPEHPLSALLQLISAFCSDLSLCVQGAPRHELLIRRCRGAYFRFNNDIVRTAPNFVVEVESQRSSSVVLPSVFRRPRSVSIGPSVLDSPCTSQSVLESPMAVHISPSVSGSRSNSPPRGRREKVQKEVIAPALGQCIMFPQGGLARETQAQMGLATVGDTDLDYYKASPEILDYDIFMKNIELKSSPMNLSDVQRIIEESVTRHLPQTISHEPKNILIQECFQEWPDISEICFRDVSKAFAKCIEGLIEKHFKKFDHGGLRERVKAIIERQLEKAEKHTMERMLWMIELEKPAFTLNHHYYIETRENYLKRFKAAREVTSTHSADRISKALSSLSAIGFRGLTEKDLHKLYDTDKYEQELTLMAEVCAYFKVAFKRIIDNVPRVIDHEFLQRTNSDMHAVLVQGLGMGEHDALHRAALLLSEDPSIGKRREDLVQTRDRLGRVLERLHDFTIQQQFDD